MKRIFIIGLPGAGKSTFIKSMQHKYDDLVDWCDFDSWLEQHFGFSCVAQYVLQEGQQSFRELERDGLMRLKKEKADIENLVVALGGGLWQNSKQKLLDLFPASIILVLEASIEACCERILNDRSRPITSHLSKLELEEFLLIRKKSFSQLEFYDSAELEDEICRLLAISKLDARLAIR